MDNYINKYIVTIDMSTTICISIPDNMHKQLEARRGDIPRSLQYQRILKKELKETK